MDGLKLQSRVMKEFVTAQLEKAIKKKFGVQLAVKLNDLEITSTKDDQRLIASVHGSVGIDKKDLSKFI